MTLKLTVDTVRAGYDFLCTTPPFDKWNLPDSDDVAFKIAQDRTAYAWLATGRRKRPAITVSEALVGHTVTLLAALAHEMVHLHQYRTGMPLTHGSTFRKLKTQVCRHHGFDPKTF